MSTNAHIPPAEQVRAHDLPPILLLDVDGVINAFHGSWGAPITRTRCAGQPIRYAPALFDRLRVLHQSGTVVIRWSSTWCGIPDQLAALTALLGVDVEPAFGPHRPLSKTWGDLKVEAALSALGEGRRVIWADDEEAAAGRRLFPAIAEAEREGWLLLVMPRSEFGLQPEDVEAINAFCRADYVAVPASLSRAGADRSPHPPRQSVA